MNLKGTLAATALTLGATFANAQSYDADKERKENPVGFPAVICASVGSYFAADLSSNDPKIIPLAMMVNNATKVGDAAYKSHDVFIWKTVALLNFQKDAFEILKATDFTAYANAKAKLHSTLNDCNNRYTTDLTPK